MNHISSHNNIEWIDDRHNEPLGCNSSVFYVVSNSLELSGTDNLGGDGYQKGEVMILNRASACLKKPALGSIGANTR